MRINGIKRGRAEKEGRITQIPSTIHRYKKSRDGIPTMRSLDSDRKSTGANQTDSDNAASASASTATGTTAVPAPTPEVIDFSKVQIEPLFEDQVDFDTFSKADFRAVKVKDCVAVSKSKKLLQFTLDDGTGIVSA